MFLGAYRCRPRRQGELRGRRLPPRWCDIRERPTMKNTAMTRPLTDVDPQVAPEWTVRLQRRWQRRSGG
jgi:hypothetical protein